MMQLLFKGFYPLRWFFLVGFVFNTIIAAYFIIGLHLTWEVLSIYVFHILFKLLAIPLLFSKPINQWIHMIKNYSINERGI